MRVYLRSTAAALVALTFLPFTLQPVSVSADITDNPVTDTESGPAAICPANGESFCDSMPFCMGINTGFFAYWSLDRPFIDQMKAASVSVPGIGGNGTTITENPNITLDDNRYPTVTGKNINVVFYSSNATTHTIEMMPAGRYVILWDGHADNAKIHGSGVSEAKLSTNRLEFNFDTTKRGIGRFAYKNRAGLNHVTNIRIVPIKFENDYENWSWSDYKIGADTNPPIFNPQWLAKYKRGCVIRYMNSRNTNDADAIRLGRDSSKHRIKPSYSAWYSGYQLENGFEIEDRSHIWPWELIVEASRQLNSTPWVNFRVSSYEQLKAGDRLIGDVARLFRDFWGGPVYVEYGNELWNSAHPFNRARDHIKRSGPGSNEIEIYANRTNAIQKAFADAYDNNGCLVQGVFAWQGRVPFNGRRLSQYADKNYIDVISPADYIGDDMRPGSKLWKFIANLRYQTERGRLGKPAAFNQIREELLTGSAGIISKNWRNDLRNHIGEYIRDAKSQGICTAMYEGGLHVRMDRIDKSNPDHVRQAEFMREYTNSHAQAHVEREINDWLRDAGSGPNLIYSAAQSSYWGTFSYWDNYYQSTAREPQRAKLIGSYASGRRPRFTPPDPPFEGPGPGPEPEPEPERPTPPPDPRDPRDPDDPRPVPRPGPGDPITCGSPSYNRTGANLYVWRNCRSGEWSLTSTGGGSRSDVTFTGTVVSTENIRNVRKFSAEAADKASVSGNKKLDFSVTVKSRDSDTVKFRTADSGNPCLTVGSNGAGILLGKNSQSVSGSINLSSGGSCSGGPSDPPGGDGGNAGCGAPDINARTDKHFRLWKECGNNGKWVVQAGAGGGADLVGVKGVIASSDTLSNFQSIGVEGPDKATKTNRFRIDFYFKELNSSPDALTFNAITGNRTCLWVTGPRATDILVGKDGRKLRSPLNLETLQRCN